MTVIYIEGLGGEGSSIEKNNATIAPRKVRSDLDLNYRNGEKGTTPRYVEIRLSRLRLHTEHMRIDNKKIKKKKRLQICMIKNSCFGCKEDLSLACDVFP